MQAASFASPILFEPVECAQSHRLERRTTRSANVVSFWYAQAAVSCRTISKRCCGRSA